MTRLKVTRLNQPDPQLPPQPPSGLAPRHSTCERPRHWRAAGVPTSWHTRLMGLLALFWTAWLRAAAAARPACRAHGRGGSPHPGRSRRSLATVLAAAALAAGTLLPAQAEVRRCDATYEWQTTGGSIGPIPLETFTARGECGSNAAANRCRDRAREAAQRCILTQWERRWQHHPIQSDGTPNPGYDRAPPESCLQAANIEGYDLSTDCTRRKDGHDPQARCHERVHPSNAILHRMAERGDLKTALETSVCCLFKEGKHAFPDLADVRVKLTARTWSSGGHSQCRSNQTLSRDYGINCQAVRAQHCSF